MLATGTASVVISVAKGILKLSRRVDLVQAERIGVANPIAVSLPVLNLGLNKRQIRDALQKLLDETKDQKPKAFGTDRAKIQTAIDNRDAGACETFFKKHLPERALDDVLDLNSAYIKQLRKEHPEWADDPDLAITAFHLYADNGKLKKEYLWRTALTVADVIAEFGSENVGLFTRDEKVQSVVGAILKRFGEADLQKTAPGDGLLRIALGATLNGVLDAKDALNTDDKWVDAILGGVLKAREAMPKAEQANFIAGLLQGKGYPVLVSSLLTSAARTLGEEDAGKLEKLTGDYLTQVAGIVKNQKSFNGFFQDHWGDLLRAGLKSVEKYGPTLLDDEFPILKEVLSAVASSLATQSNSKFLSSDALVGMMNVVISAAAAKPDLLDGTIGEKWLAELTKSIATTVADKGIRKAFTKEGISAMTTGALETFAENPELLISKPGLSQELVQGVLKSLAKSETMAAEDLAQSALSGALDTLADHPELLEFPYAQSVVVFTGKIGALVKERKLTTIQGHDLLTAVGAILSENPELFLNLEKRLPGWIVEVVTTVASKQGAKVPGNATLTGIAVEMMQALAKSGKTALTLHAANDLPDLLETLLTVALKRATAEVGKNIKNSDIPKIIGELSALWAQGRITNLDPDDVQFEKVFTSIVTNLVA